MKLLSKIILCLIFFLTVIDTTTSQAQEPARPIDNTELARPKPLFTISEVSGDNLIKLLSDSLKIYDFEIIRFDKKDMQIEAKREFVNGKKGFDKVIVWLERDFHMPEKFVKVFLIYGRFERIISAETRVQRIEISEEFEDLIIGDLKKSLVLISI